jgi:hypothetical protein
MIRQATPCVETDEVQKASRKAERRLGQLTKRLEIFQRDRFTCMYCGRSIIESVDSFMAATLDHIKPRHAGGSNDETNLATSCFCCNHLKGGAVVRNIHEARQLIADLRQARRERCEESLALVGAELGQTTTMDGLPRVEWVDMAAMADQAAELLWRIKAVGDRLTPRRKRPSWWQRLLRL